jgi:hypothetical protein
VGPIFLFDVGIVIFVMGAATGELNGVCPFGKMSEEVIIQEFGSIIAIEPQQGEGKRFFDLLDLFEDPCFSLSPDRSLFSPVGGNIDAANRIGQHPEEGFTAMGDGVGFEETGTGFVPLVGFNGDLFS